MGSTAADTLGDDTTTGGDTGVMNTACEDLGLPEAELRPGEGASRDGSQIDV